MTDDERGWLVDARARPDDSVVLLFFIGSRSGRRIERTISPYVPYCFIHPEMGGEPVQKRNLFTDSLMTVGKVRNSRLPKGAQVWEDEIRSEMSCVYDLRLNYGAEHDLQDDLPRLRLVVDPEVSSEFEGRFGSLRGTDPTKFQFLERFCALLEQPIPEFDPADIGLSSGTTGEQYASAFTLSRIANLPLSQVQRRQSVSEWIRSALHTYYRANNILVPNPEELRKGVQRTTVEGALTFPPVSGLYYGMKVLDFESLYPSCIDTFNLSYETVDCQHPRCRSNLVPSTEHYVCLEKRGVFSAFTGALRDLRVRWYKPRARDPKLPQEEHMRCMLIARLLKLLTVSCYGVTVRIRGLASPILAESITAYGRYALRTTWRMAEELGLSPKYGDTDSIFLDRAGDEDVASLVGRVRRELGLELAVDKRYSLCVLTSAKKAYLGIEANGTTDIKGLTVAKSNSPPFFRQVLLRIVKSMAGMDSPEGFEEMKRSILQAVDESVAQLRSGKVGVQDLEYKVELWKEPKEKFDSQILPQAYQAAKLLQSRGRSPRRREEIAFVKVHSFKVGGRSFTVKPASETRANEINTEDYVRSLVQSLSQITAPMGIDLAGSRMKSLSEYM